MEGEQLAQGLRDAIPRLQTLPVPVNEGLQDLVRELEPACRGGGSQSPLQADGEVLGQPPRSLCSLDFADDRLEAPGTGKESLDLLADNPLV
ncbi:MAG: hypothetical protein ACO4B4_12170 [Planctomycetota bacterium]